MKKRIVLFLSGFCAACTSPSAQITNRLTPYLGETRQEIFLQMGVPDALQTVQDKTYATYLLNDTIIIPATPYSFKMQTINDAVYTQTAGNPMQSFHEFCRLTFEFTNDIVTNTHYLGNGCLNLIPSHK